MGSVPYSYKECKENGWLLTEDWDRYDMREAIMASTVSERDIKELTQRLYKSFASPQYIMRKVLSIRSMDDVRFLGRAGKKLIGHLTDFKAREKRC